jgi:hypothetical protein
MCKATLTESNRTKCRVNKMERHYGLHMVTTAHGLFSAKTILAVVGSSGQTTRASSDGLGLKPSIQGLASI